jgi:hypothetical protein
VRVKDSTQALVWSLTAKNPHGRNLHQNQPHRPLKLNWRVLIATCKQLVWSIRIGRNIPIWVLHLILGSGPGAAFPLEVTGSGGRSLFYTGLPGDPRSLYYLSYYYYLIHLFPEVSAFAFCACLTEEGCLQGEWGRCQHKGSAEVSDPVAPPLNGRLQRPPTLLHPR